MPDSKFATKGNLLELAAAAKEKYEPKSADIVHDSNYVHSDTNYTAADKAKLDSVEEGANAYSLPEMSFDTRGGAKLEEHGGLVLRDESLGIGSLVQESDGAVRGSIAGLTAEGHAEQVSTTGKNLLPNNATSKTMNGVTLTVNADGSITANGTATARSDFFIARNVVLAGGTYTISGAPSTTNNSLYNVRCEDNAEPRTQRMRNDGTTASSNVPTGTIPANTPQDLLIRIYSGVTVSNLTFYPQLELGSTATEYEPYTGGVPSPSPEFPQTIDVVRGRNLWRYERGGYISNGTYVSGTKSNAMGERIPCKAGQKYTTSAKTLPDNFQVAVFSDSGAYHSSLIMDPFDTFTAPITGYMYVWVNKSGVPSDELGQYGIQLTLGSTPQPYVPYGHVGLEARDPDTDELISCTALPLPSRGWVGSLPDGTADVLTLDGAGKVEWESTTNMVTFDGSSDEVWTLQNSGKRVRLLDNSIYGPPNTSTTANALSSHFVASTPGLTWTGNIGFSLDPSVNETRGFLFADGTGSMTLDAWKTWLSTHPVTVLYPLATPVTEECGYVDMPAIPSYATVSIPELDALGVRYFVDDSVTEYGRQMYARAYAELGDAITELAARVSALES